MLCLFVPKYAVKAMILRGKSYPFTLQKLSYYNVKAIILHCEGINLSSEYVFYSLLGAQVSLECFVMLII